MSTDDVFILGVDLDGVCGDHTAAFREVVAKVKEVPLDALPLARSWSFTEWDLDPEGFDYYHRIAVLEQHMFATMPVMDGCADALWRLNDAGIWIRIITHRLYVNWGHATSVSDTVKWLDSSQIPYRDICFLGAKPQVEAHAYIDDAPHNVEALREAGNTVIVFDQPYNQHVEGLRAHDWGEVNAIVEQLAADAGLPVQAQFPGFDSGADRLTRRTNSDE